MERNRPANRRGSGTLGALGGGGSGSSGHESPQRSTDNLPQLDPLASSPSLLLRAAARRLYAERQGPITMTAQLYTSAQIVKSLQSHAHPLLSCSCAVMCLAPSKLASLACRSRITFRRERR